MLSIVTLSCLVSAALGIITITSPSMVIGNSSTITCKVSPLLYGITFGTSRYPSHADQANCFHNRDLCLPSAILNNPNITFSSNYTIGEFYINIASLNLEDKTNYTCIHGSDEILTKFICSGYIPTSRSIEEQNRVLKINTGCTFPASEVTIKLFYTTTVDNQTYEYNITAAYHNEDMHTCGCHSGCGCGMPKSTLELDVIYENKRQLTVTFHAEITLALIGVTWTTLSTENQYNITITEEATDEDPKRPDTDNTVVYIGAVIGAVAFCGCVGVPGGCAIYNKIRENNREKKVHSQNTSNAAIDSKDENQTDVSIDIHDDIPKNEETSHHIELLVTEQRFKNTRLPPMDEKISGDNTTCKDKPKKKKKQNKSRSHTNETDNVNQHKSDGPTQIM